MGLEHPPVGQGCLGLNAVVATDCYCCCMQTIEFMGRCLACPEPVPESVSSRPTGAEGVPKFPRRWAALAYDITYDLAMLWHVGLSGASSRLLQLLRSRLGTAHVVIFDMAVGSGCYTNFTSDRLHVAKRVDVGFDAAH